MLLPLLGWPPDEPLPADDVPLLPGGAPPVRVATSDCRFASVDARLLPPCVLVVSSGVPTVWIVELLPVVEPLPVVELPNIISIKLTLFDKGEPGPLAPGLATDVSAAVVPTLLDADPDCAARGAWRAASCAHCTFCSIIELITCRSPLLMIGWGEACTIRAISRALKDNGSADPRRHLMPARWDRPAQIAVPTPDAAPWERRHQRRIVPLGRERADTRRPAQGWVCCMPQTLPVTSAALNKG